MRKITHLLTLLLMVLSLQSFAQDEGFETTAVGSIPNGWTRYQSENDDPGFEVQDQTGYAYEGTHYLVHEGVDITTESTSWVVSNSIHVGAGYELKFAWRGRWSNAYNYSGIYISTASNDPVANPGDFTELQEFSPANYPNTWLLWNEETINLASSTYANQNIYIAFKYVGDHAHDFFIDKVVVAPMPYCESPQNLAVSDRGFDYIDVDWTGVIGATEYEVAWGTPGFDPTNNPANTMVVTTNAAHITGLTQETEYDIYVRTNCSSFNHSLWTGPVNVTTAGPPPANDDCTNAINLTVYDNNASAGNETDANTINATDSGTHPSCDDIGVNLDVWYTFTVPAGEDQVMVITAGTNGSTIEAALYDSCGGTEMDCKGPSNTKIFSGLTAGQTYTLQVWHDEYNAGPFKIAIEKLPPAPVNDDCANALSLTVYDSGASAGNETPASNFSAHDSGIHPSCDNTGVNLDVWYNFTVPAGENSVYVLTGGAQGDKIKAAVYDSCGGAEMDCKGTGNIKQFIGLTAGQTYILQVWTDNTDAGPFNIALEKTPPPPACGDTFYDDGGATGDYSANMNYAVTLVPDTTGDLVTVTFNSFDMEQGYDGVMIYDGLDNNAPLFDSGSTFGRPTCPDGAWTGDPSGAFTADGHSFTATNAAGAITLVFTSDFTVQRAGWEAVVSCSPPPSCPAPSYLSASNITDTQADLSWTQLGSVNTWNIEYGSTGFTQGNGTMINGVTNNPYTLTGLSASMSYDFYVQADCGSGDTSTWSGPYTFSTACGVVSNFPYNYGFEDVPSNTGGDWDISCWSADPQNTGSDAYSGPYRWTVTDGGTPSSATGPDGAHSGTQYAYTESSGSDNGDQAMLISPVFDLSSLTTPQVTFYYHMFGDTMGSLSFDTYDGTTWTNDVWTVSGEQQSAEADPWLSISVVIPQNTTQFRFRGTRGGGYTSDMAVDDITVEEAPTCPAPIGLSASNIQDYQVDLTWTENGSATTWNIEYGPSGFTQGQGTTISGVTNNPYTLTGLTPSTNYDFYVQSVCGTNDTSTWTGPYTFSTACGTVTTYPYTYGFEDVPSNDEGNWDTSCWSADPQNTGADAFSGPYRWTVTDGTTPSSSTGPSSAHSGTQYAYAESSGSNPGDEAMLISPVFDMSSLTTPQISFFYYMYGMNIGSLSLDTYDGTTWTNDVWTLSGQAQASDSDPWLIANVVVPQNTTQFRFRAVRGADYTSDIAIDDIIVLEAPSCPMPTGLSASNILANQADLSWTPGNNETMWNIEYGPTGFTQGSGTVISGITSNPYTLTGLTPETSYDFYVQADCGSGDTSIWAGPYTFVTPVSCPAPSGLNASNIHTDQADLGWIPGSTETMWNIEYGPAGFTQGNGTLVNGVTNNPYTLTGLSSGTAYDFYVQADCGGGDSSTWVGPYTFMTPPGCGDTIYDDGGPNGDYSPNLNISFTIYPDNAGDVVTVTFNSFDMEEGYDGVMIYDGVDTGAPLFDSGSTFGEPTCPDGAWTGAPGDTYTADGHSFTATNTDGALTLVFMSDYTIQLSGWEASIACAPSALTDHQIEGVKFYPNPVDNTLNITAGKNIESVRIYSITGQEVINARPESTQTQINMSRLRNGVYFVKAQINGQLTAFKVVKK